MTEEPRTWVGRLYRRLLLVPILLIGLMGGYEAVHTPAQAKPPAAAEFCKLYPGSGVCQGVTAAPCATCHTSAPERNLFGAQLAEALDPGVSRPLSDETFLSGLPAALKAIENKDADGDGFTNVAELQAGSRPDDSKSVPTLLASCNAAQAQAGARMRWDTCGYDPAYAFRKVHLDFCGRSPTRAETDSFAALRNDEAAWKAKLSAALDQCLQSKYWLGENGVVWNLANPKILPAISIKAGKNSGPIPLADYDWDYNLFSYINSGDRDVRDLLTGKYYVTRTSDDPPSFKVLNETELATFRNQLGQLVPVDQRAGMITTHWFGVVNTMFTAIPRTTAATAYRAYLGHNIAKMQGLHPVMHEPVDYDAKGVEAPECAVCHSTLDPLAYPFSRYNGISGGGTYSTDRLKDYIRSDGATVVDAPPSGVIFDTPVKNLVEWGQVAANSNDFAQKVVYDYWVLLVGREPDVQDQAEYTKLWRDLMDPKGANYRVEKMLHELVLTNAYAAP